MSQEINLINPTLRRKRDWLTFDVVAPTAVVVLVVVGVLSVYTSLQAAGLQRQGADLAAQVAAVQEELQLTKTSLATRKNDPAIEQEAQSLSAAVRQRKEVFRLAEGSASDGSGGVAEIMRGFSRQFVDGVWLTGFVVGPGNFEIRGRLLEPSLLPAYIRRLNAEPAFRGRRFAALDMHAASEVTSAAGSPPASGGVPPAVSTLLGGAAPAAATPAAAPKYTEFALRAIAVPPAPAGAGQ
jgi:hypothetical protein